MSRIKALASRRLARARIRRPLCAALRGRAWRGRPQRAKAARCARKPRYEAKPTDFRNQLTVTKCLNVTIWRYESNNARKMPQSVGHVSNKLLIRSELWVRVDTGPLS